MLDDLGATRAAYDALLGAGLNPDDVGLAITQAAFDADEARQADPEDTLWGTLSPVEGVYTGGVWMMVGGPLTNFAATGSLIALLMNHGLNESDVAWLHDALHMGRPMIAVRSVAGGELDVAKEVLCSFPQARLMPSAQPRRRSNTEPREVSVPLRAGHL